MVNKDEYKYVREIWLGKKKETYCVTYDGCSTVTIYITQRVGVINRCMTALIVRWRVVPAGDPARRHGAGQLVAVSRPARLHEAPRRVGQLQRRRFVVDVVVRQR